MHSIYEMKFRRRFSINPYKTLRMKLGGMDCYKNWVDDRRGDPYPVVSGNEHEGAFLAESLPSARYRAENHTEELLFKARLLGQHFPYATYEIALDDPGASPLSGLGVQIQACAEAGSAYTKENEPCLRIWASVEEGMVQICREITAGGAAVSFETIDSGKQYAPGMSLTVTSRGRFFDVYLDDGTMPGFVCSFEVKELSEILHYDTFVRSSAALLVRVAPGDSVQGAAEFFLEGGISHADMKCMRYENGMPVMERGPPVHDAQRPSAGGRLSGGGIVEPVFGRRQAGGRIVFRSGRRHVVLGYRFVGGV